MSAQFFSDKGRYTPVGRIYSGIDVVRILNDSIHPTSNIQRRLNWGNKVEKLTGKFPSLNGLEPHRCCNCSRTVWVPKGSKPNPLTVFCSEECELEQGEYAVSDFGGESG